MSGGELDEMIGESFEEGYELVDDEIAIDMSEAANFDPFTAVVPVEVTKATLKAGTTSKKPYLELQLRVFEGEFEARTLFTNINLTGKGAGFAAVHLRALGYDFDSKHPKVSPKRLIGLRALAACAPDEREEYAHKVVVNKLSKYVSQAEEEADNLK